MAWWKYQEILNHLALSRTNMFCAIGFQVKQGVEYPVIVFY